jgi:hypothetical protein
LGWASQRETGCNALTKNIDRANFGFWILDFGFWILDFGFWILDVTTQPVWWCVVRVTILVAVSA